MRADDPDKGRGGLSDTILQRKVTCPQCGNDKLSIYADGHEHCFKNGCGYHKGPTVKEPSQASHSIRGHVRTDLIKPEAGAYRDLSKLCLSEKTAQRFGYFIGGHEGRKAQIAPLYDQTGNQVAQEVRLPGDQYVVLGDQAAPLQMWGVHVWGDGRDRKVVVHSTKVAAMAASQVTNFKVPNVAPPVGNIETLAAACKQNYRWLDRFQEIVLFLEDTDVGRRVTQDVAAMFPSGKVKLAKVNGARDASDALIQNRPGDIDQAIWNAAVWRPSGIVNAADGAEALFEEGLQTPSWPYPWPEFNDMSMGMRPGEVTYHVGGTGIAKSTLLFHYIVHLLLDDGREFIKGFPVQPPTNVGYLGFEDLTKQAKVAMLGIYEGKVLTREPISKEEGVRLHRELFDSRRFYMYDAEQAEYGLEAVKGYIRYLGRACGCRIIVVDPLTFIVSQLPVANRTQEEDKLAGWLAAEAKAMGVHIHIGYHLRKPDGTPCEEGAAIGLPDIKGSGALSHFAHNVLAYERDQQGGRPDLLQVRSLKNRVGRFTGVVGVLKYDMQTGRYEPTDEEFPERKKPKGKAKSNDF
jgi:twinkle protein